MKVAIIGSRTVSLTNEEIDLEIKKIEEEFNTRVDFIVSGGAIGVDTSAADYATSKGLQLQEFLPNMKRFGRNAPLIRDRYIANSADLILAFWDGSSKGTKYTLSIAPDTCIIRIVRKNKTKPVITGRLF